MAKAIQGDYIAIKDSYGFRGRFWQKDEIANNVSGKELECPELKYFTLITDGTKKRKPVQDEPKTFAELSEEVARDPILDAFGEDVTAEIPINPNA